MEFVTASVWCNFSHDSNVGVELDGITAPLIWHHQIQMVSYFSAWLYNFNSISTPPFKYNTLG